MGEDLSAAAKIGISLIIMCSLIAIVFSILSIMKNISTAGANDLQQSLNRMNATKYQGYDQQEITGTEALTAIKLYQNKPMIFCVVTTSSANIGVYGLTSVTLTYTTAATTFVPANATTTKANFNTYIQPAHSSFTGYVAGSLPATYTYNNNRANLNDSTSAYYLSPQSRFMSYLIRTSTNQVIGMIFIEQ